MWTSLSQKLARWVSGETLLLLLLDFGAGYLRGGGGDPAAAVGIRGVCGARREEREVVYGVQRARGMV
jgi:hypothetical protein